METIKYRNKFRLRLVTSTRDKLRLNTMTDVNGVDRFVEGFDTLAECEATLNLWVKLNNIPDGAIEIETYPEAIAQLVPSLPQSEAGRIVNAEYAKQKVWNGKGLRHNTSIHPKDERKYAPHKFYGRETYMFQSTERNKGQSVNRKVGKFFTHGESTTKIDSYDKGQRTGAGTNEYAKVEHLGESKGNPNVFDPFIISIRNMGFANRKEVKDYLRKMFPNISHRQMKLINHKVFNK